MQLEPQELTLGNEAVSFEHRCAVLERHFCQQEYDLICSCCAEEESGLICDACKYAVGFHKCLRADRWRWRKGSLFAGELDAQRVLFNLHRHGLPSPALHKKAEEYVAAGILRIVDADAMLRSIEQERGCARTFNDLGGTDGAAASNGRVSAFLSSQQLVELLEERLDC